jgi:hypothetical protein
MTAMIATASSTVALCVIPCFGLNSVNACLTNLHPSLTTFCLPLCLNYNRIHDRINDRWDDPRGPFILAIGLIIALLFNFGIKVGN